MCRRRLCRRRSGIEWMSCGGEIRAGCGRLATRMGGRHRFDRPSEQLRIYSISKRRRRRRRRRRRLTRKSTQTTPLELSSTLERSLLSGCFLPFGRKLNCGRGRAEGRNLSMVKSPFYLCRCMPHADRRSARGSFIDPPPPRRARYIRSELRTCE